MLLLLLLLNSCQVTSSSAANDVRVCVQTSVKSRLPPGIDMNVNVLTSGYWPSYPHLEAKLPDELTRYQTVFKVTPCLLYWVC